jgi:sugar/nucleoside kinase (ribokinase family)
MDMGRTNTGVRRLNIFDLKMLNPTAFKYLTPKLRLDEASLSEAQVMANAFHLVCSSQRCISLVEGILSRRQNLAGPGVPEPVRPRFVWEPVPDLCMPEELDMLRRAVCLVDIVSPNAEEFAAFFASPRPQRELAAQILGWRIGIDGEGVLVVREGSHGCSAYSRSWDCHLPAFYDQAQSSAVLDPTGGGNAFLGALAMALGGKVQPPFADLKSQLMLSSVSEATNPLGCVKMICALVYATIAASYAIQQSGMPLLSGNEVNGETWNGESFGSRVSAYIKRENDHIIANLKKDEA